VDKLVRDRIPHIMRAEGNEPVVRTLTDDQDFLHALLNKLVEESAEAYTAMVLDSTEQNNSGEQARLVEELADVLEVLDAIKSVMPDWSVVLSTQQKKRRNRGGFSYRYVLTQ
jgi:predicted house-cleaning noncanonical NTP pyrophosphatase (MazG superfamily)